MFASLSRSLSSLVTRLVTCQTRDRRQRQTECRRRVEQGKGMSYVHVWCRAGPTPQACQHLEGICKDRSMRRASNRICALSSLSSTPAKQFVPSRRLLGRLQCCHADKSVRRCEPERGLVTAAWLDRQSKDNLHARVWTGPQRKRHRANTQSCVLQPPQGSYGERGSAAGGGLGSTTRALLPLNSPRLPARM